ncbi:hypothetical protein OROGR_018824 [Orobanche gracilis]
MFFKIRPSREILKIRDGTPLKAGEILTHIKSPRNGSVCYFSSKLDVPSNVVQKIRVARILFFKIRPSREILKIRDGTRLEAGEILTYIKSPRNGSICYFSRKLDVPSNGVQKKRVARILFFKIRPSREILKIRDGTPLEAGEILTYIKSPRNGSICYFSRKLDVPSNVVQKKRVARILFFKIRPSREILKIRDGTPLKAGEILTYIKSPRNGSVCYFYSKLYVPSNVVQKKRVAPILFFKIRPSQEILRIRDTPSLEAGEILTYIKKPSKRISLNFKNSGWYPFRGGGNFDIHKKPSKRIDFLFSSKLDVPSNVVQKKRVARILFFKIRPSREILKIRDGTPLKAGEILTYIKSPRNGSVCYFSSKFDVPSNVVQKKRVARILFFKIRPSREILKIRDGTPLEAGKILTYIKSPRNGSAISRNFKNSLKAGEILTYIKSPRNGSVCYFSSNLDVPSNVVQKIRVARILFFKIRPSREILKIRDGTPFEAGEILTYIKSPRNGSIFYFSSKLDVPSNVVQKKRVARILFFKIRPSREILKIRDGTPLKAGEILTYIKSLRNGSVCYFSSMFDVPSNLVQKKRVARILFFKIRPSREILKIRDGTPLKAGEILIYIKNPRNGSVCYFYSKLYVPSNVVQKKRVAPILFFKIRPSQEILKIRDTLSLEAGEILTYIKKPSKRINVPSNVVQKIRVARILFFKIRPSREILKIRDGTTLEAGEILTYIKSPRNGSICYFSRKLDVPSNVVQKKRVAQILFFKIRPSREILKIRDGTSLKAGEILTYIKSPRNGSVCYFYSKLYVPSNVVQKKRVAPILFFKIRASQEILKIRDTPSLEAGEILTYIKKPSKRISLNFKIRDGTPLEYRRKVARIMFFKIRPSREILKIRDGTPLKAGEILTHIKSPRNGSVCYFSSKLDVLSNVVQKIRVARILFFKIRPSREILKIRDGTRLEAGEILTYIKSPRNGSICYFSRKLDVPSNVVQKKRVARILFFKIRPSREILKIRDGTPLEAGEILTYIKSPRNGSICYFSRKLDVPSNVVQKKRVARILFFKIRPSREILKIRDGTPLKAGEILTYIKSPRNGSVCYFYSKLYVPSNVVQKKRVAPILFFKIRPSQEILRIRDTPSLEAGEILTYIKKPSKRISLVARILFFKIRPSREIFKIRDGTPFEAGEILTYIKSPRNGSIFYFSSKLDVPSNVVQKKRVARILFFKIRPSREILKIRDGTPLKAGEILTYIKSPRNGSVCYFSSKFDVPSNVVQKKRVARILFFKIRPSREILKIRDGTPLEAGNFDIHKKPSKRIDLLLF